MLSFFLHFHLLLVPSFLFHWGIIQKALPWFPLPSITQALCSPFFLLCFGSIQFLQDFHFHCRCSLSLKFSPKILFWWWLRFLTDPPFLGPSSCPQSPQISLVYSSAMSFCLHSAEKWGVDISCLLSCSTPHLMLGVDMQFASRVFQGRCVWW